MKNKTGDVLLIDGTSNKIEFATIISDKFDSSSFTGKVYDDLLDSLNLYIDKKSTSWEKISTIVITTGPGSFTNIRLIASVINAIKIVHKHIEILTISSIYPIIKKLFNDDLEQNTYDFGLRITKTGVIKINVLLDNNLYSINYESLIVDYEGKIFDIFVEIDGLIKEIYDLFLHKQDLFEKVNFVDKIDYCSELFSYKKVL